MPEVPGAHPVAGESFARRLNRLFDVVHPKDRGAYTNAEVAADMGVSAVLVSRWRTGRAADPRRGQMEGLAGFFGVPPAYFVENETAGKITDELEMVRVMRENGVQRVALRAAGLSPESMKTVLTMIHHVRASEGLPRLPDEK
ncbi:helix-turn-helix domain-containing protein [Streptomyces sp. NPDC094034]|uniref:helix-turn-helix domain-containing protein n=1 Tax=Streptomyces sp. NPDC094034 TaxID=3155309 RepID=UPI003319B855